MTKKLIISNQLVKQLEKRQKLTGSVFYLLGAENGILVKAMPLRSNKSEHSCIWMPNITADSLSRAFWALKKIKLEPGSFARILPKEKRSLDTHEARHWNENYYGGGGVWPKTLRGSYCVHIEKGKVIGSVSTDDGRYPYNAPVDVEVTSEVTA